MPGTAIQVDNLSKQYAIGARENNYTTFREAVSGLLTNPLRRLKLLSGQVTDDDKFWALKDISFKVEPGEVVGIIGRNGAGKSTLLKILSRITEPTTGRVEINGRVASLLEVGTGFHAELTGRENIFLNGAILGMSRSEIARKFDEIVEFSCVEKFLDTPIKRYSSGMTVRLAFAVAAHLDPEILIIDEVLAVGDSEFQKRCLSKMQDVSRGGRTVLFVSHNMGAVRSLCSRTLVLEEGECRFDGTTDHGLAFYSQGAPRDGEKWTRAHGVASAPLMFLEISANLEGQQPNLSLVVDMTLGESSAHPPAFVAIDISDAVGTVIMQALPRPLGFIKSGKDTHRFRLKVALPPLIPGSYSISPWVGPTHSHTYDFAETAVSFNIEMSPTKNRTFPHTSDHGCIVPESSVIEYD